MKFPYKEKNKKMNPSERIKRQLNSDNATKRSKIFYKIPRVVADQRARFYKDDIFRIHNKYMEVRWFWYADIQSYSLNYIILFNYLLILCVIIIFSIIGKIYSIQRSANGRTQNKILFKLQRGSYRNSKFILSILWYDVWFESIQVQ